MSNYLTSWNHQNRLQINGHIIYDCPHCGIKKCAFTISNIIDRLQPGNRNKNIILFAICNNCKKPISALAQSHCNADTLAALDGDILEKSQSIEIFPELHSQSIPESIPDNVKNFYRQAITSLDIGNYDAAGMMFRKTLEIALKSYKPSLTGNLVSRINELGKNHELTPAMVEWANTIRLEGNKAAHEDFFTEEEANQMKMFCHFTLIYLFTLPSAIEKSKKHTDE